MRIAAGFALSSVLLVVIGAVSYASLDKLTSTAQWVNHTHEVLEHISNVLSDLKDAETGQRGYLITGDEAYLEPYQSGTRDVEGVIRELRKLTADNPAEQRRIDALEPLVASKLAELKQTIDLRRKGDADGAVKIVRNDEGKRFMDEVRRVLADMDSEERALLQQRGIEAEAAAATAKSFIVWGTVLCLVAVIVAGTLLTRTLGSQIGESVGHIQSSATELQAAANQQATATKEQATAMSEISTTISELLATSRQIAESAQRVAQIAAQTATAARSGDDIVATAHQSIAGIRQQVDLIVSHMLELGKKSQQIGSVLDIVAELAEQTNILAINATIEAAGASEAGRRFAVVADEIRKLADRVAGSTKEIRTLIEDVRSSVNATVMTTEGGSKSVDAGAKQFSEVAASFGEIAALVGTTTEAAREIELSTKQQSTAVEQVNIAITSAAQATKETEASSGQTLQTAGELSTLSYALLRIVQPQEKRGSAAA
ncbi:MAG TPA: CHASE3 domain-containing protein [Steroidobacteraceae bacterium]|jgi:CHASE3 domain sensor protein|nr:CHASE3 domain-containing protein [Steroidobacteraceae bacterium]